MRIIRKIWNVFQGAELLLALSVVLVITVPLLSGISPYVVLSGSMEPAIQTGSLAFIEKTDAGSLKKGDIICFQSSPSTVTTHRIYSIASDGRITTKGDANRITDPKPVNPKNIIGKYRFSVPFLGYGSAWIKTKQGLIVCGMVLIFNAMISIILRDESSEEKAADEQRERRKA